ncbi:Na+/H+ antiporter subunit E [Streptoalloteichus hindustanus]|uniref:Multisubunit sodium/proton antiporter, MrpE subunit n=1 Tax=Streptoalloteichus hindustanus TaxID=2017 RepID=A0A1M5P6Y2_STRHI|nr:Na+/H+ antiporter subunit E [Streptoalloteichus hindustanus]SHG97522.1 multisubunit sodium/proton antiporter, MrpE subunit [Streptoalloteichus hindustanus]
MGIRDRLRQAWRRRTGAIGLVVVWLLLWGSVTPLAVLGGVVVAAFVVVLFPLPPLAHRLRVRPLWLVVLLVRLLVDLVVSTVTVTREVVRRGGRVRTAIVAVPLRVRSDLLVTLTANVVSVTPGTLVMELDRNAGVLYAHVLPAPDDPERVRHEVWAIERQVARAFGPDEDVDAALRRP